MSQLVKVLSFSVHGRPYIGDDKDGNPVFARSGDQTAQWLASATRTRFNQMRSTRSKYVVDSATKQLTLDADGLPVLEPIGTTVTDISNTAARGTYNHLAALPAMLMHHAVKAEAEEWFGAAARRKTNAANGNKAGRMPSFKSRHRAELTFGCYANNGNNIPMRYQKCGKRTGVIHLYGQNPSGRKAPGHGARWTLAIRVKLSQDIKKFTSIQVNVTRKSLVFTNIPGPIDRSVTGAIAGLDVGVVHTMTSSDGVFFDRPPTAPLVREKVRLQRKMSRLVREAKAAGRQYFTDPKYVKTKAAHKKVCEKTTRVLTDWQHKTTTQLVIDYDFLALETLKLERMTRSAKGTLDNPGTRVAQKRSLNRAMRQSALGCLTGMLENKALLAGTTLVRVPAAHTSQRCNTCGHIDKGNRETQARFLCTRCGHTANADVNAARNILDRAQGLWGGPLAPGAKRQKTETGQLVTAAAA